MQGRQVLISNVSKVSLSISESPEIGPSVVVHTTVTFGSEHLDSDPAEVQELILNHLERIVPSLPKPASIKCQKWRYSQVLCGGISQLGGCCWDNAVVQTCGVSQETGHNTTQWFSCSGSKRKGDCCSISRSHEQHPRLANNSQIISSHLFT